MADRKDRPEFLSRLPDDVQARLDVVLVEAARLRKLKEASPPRGPRRSPSAWTTCATFGSRALVVAKPNPPQMSRLLGTASVAAPTRQRNQPVMSAARKYPSPISSSPGSRKDLSTRHGHRLDEAVSSLQKSIRRGLVDDAAYWACELMEGYYAYLWRRLKVILSEDIGIAEPHLPATIHALYQTAEQQRRRRASTGI